ncbi:MAG: UDP-N-acetylmuramoyl-L-alanyl-D-glutamate--2,6-diaminopimelate ligase [Oscillospiraceae bacterium]|nr:UDP-N-acetylmuramoyl-L-alanyl-D-glutamate--2,6-diaminopimelate ligase [Oscillospiraceae bacterium]
MKLSELLRGVPGAELHGDAEIRGVSYDSRTTRPGDLFVAVTGFAADGHRFIPMALEKGAAAVLCERVPEGLEVPYAAAGSTRTALAQVGANWYGHPADHMRVVGVTGTNGKTTATYLLKAVLERCLGAKVGLIGTIQNMIGAEVLETERTTPESFELQGLLARMLAAGCSHVLMEVSSHALVLNRVDHIPFAVGVFTNLTEDHLDFHKTMEEYGRAKSLLFTRCEKSVVNLDDPAAAQMRRAARGPVLTYAVQGGAELQAERIELASDHVAFEAVRDGARCPVRLGIPGGFTVYNALAVLGAAVQLGVPLADAAAALAEARGVKGRVEVVPTPDKDYTVLIDYAHTPDGLENVLRAVNGFCRGRVIAVFGCGGDRDPIKRPIMGRIGVELSDLAVITSDNPRTEDPNAIIEQIVAGFRGTKKPYVVIENRRAAIRWAMDHAEKDDIIVLAGKGHETYQILGTEKTHLDEREEVAAHLAGR